jgi:hypothetical protein
MLSQQRAKSSSFGHGIRESFTTAAQRIATASMSASHNWSRYKDEGGRIAQSWEERYAEAEKTRNGAMGGFAAQSRGDRGPLGGIGSGRRSAYADDPNHPTNFKRKMDQSRRMAETESMKDWPRVFLYGCMGIVSLVTIGLNMVQDEANPWGYLEPIRYVDYEEEQRQKQQLAAAAAAAAGQAMPSSHDG